MAFTKGKAKTGGRKKGVKNKDPFDLQERALALGVDPFQVLCLFAAGDWKKLGYNGEKIIIYSKDIQNEEYTIPPTTRMKAAAEAAQYLYPKKKAVEHSGSIDQNVEGAVKVVITLPDNGRSLEG